MRDDREQWLRQRAYAIWEDEGHPNGRDREHWEKAERELAANGAPDINPDNTSAPSEPAPVKKPRRRTATKLSAATARSSKKKATELRP
jgi:hypothetical protein